MRVPYRKQRLEAYAERLRRVYRSLAGGSKKLQRVYRVSIRGLDAKLIKLAHASEAARVEELLEQLRSTCVAPGVIARDGSDLWVEFLQGRPLSCSEVPPVGELGKVFRKLYCQAPQMISGCADNLADEVVRDLENLESAGLFDHACRCRLEERARAWAPDLAWIGFDYLDARPANLLQTPGGLRIVDVESLCDGELIGTGAARAWSRWPHVERESLLSAIAAPAVPDFASYADFLELRFLARWTLRWVLHRKLRLIEAGGFEIISRRVC